jgi:hypothetical protein
MQFADSIDPESIAINALIWIASDEKMLERFLNLTGIDADQIRDAAREPAFLAGVLKFIVADEASLMRFAEKSDLHPSIIVKALHHLPFGQEEQS